MNTEQIDAEVAVQRTMHELPKPDGWENVRTFRELQTTGLLWLINSVVFHPRGYSLGMVPGDDDEDRTGPYYGWNLLGDGSVPWVMPEDDETDRLFASVEAFFADHRKP